MVQLFEQDIKTNDRQSSKGNQLKWRKNDLWYKADYMGYEGLTEYMTSHLLMFSTLSPELITPYDTEQIRYKNVIYRGCVSRHFLQDGEQLLTLERIFKNETGKSLYRAVFDIQDHEARFPYLIGQVQRYTGIEGFGEYMAQILTIDALFLNEDRHMHNIALILKPDGDYRLCPVFDLGAGLLSDTGMDYPIGDDLFQLIDSVQAKTISDDFLEQVDLADSLYGQTVHFSFTRKDVDRLLDEEPYYPEEMKDRVRLVLYEQMRRYAYLFEQQK